MKILVTGGNGQVATAISHNFPAHWNIKFLSHQLLDIGNQQALQTVIAQFFPDIIINTAAFTAVDMAEKNPAAAFYANRDAVFTLASICATNHIPLLHLSTDYIFDGKQNSPYQEIDQPNPLNIYGLSKWEGEEAIRGICQMHIILRVSSVFSPYGKNFVKTILQLAKQQETLTIVADQTHCPTSANSIAAALQTIIRNLSDNLWGTYHYCNSPPTTWYDFAKAIIAIGKNYCALQVNTIDKTTGAEFKAFADRPSYSVLTCAKIGRVFALTQPHWQEELEKVIETSI